MEQSLDKKPELKDTIQSFFNKNKKKIFLFISLVIVMTVALYLWKDNKHKKNILISEKYTKAQLFLSKNEKEAAAKHYEEIIFNKNEFYSILALNKILEKNLENDKKKILEYFNILEKINYSKETSDMIKFKKALYLMKNNEIELSRKLLNDLIKENSSLKKAAQEIISK